MLGNRITQEATVPLIHEQLVKVSDAIGAIGKTRDNTQQGFKFRGIDEFLNAAHPVFIAHGVTVVPQVVDRHIEFHPRDRGFWTHVWLTMDFHFTADDGSHVTARTCGEGLDLADKATNKAMSAALKYALMQTLTIPLKDMADSDADDKNSTYDERPAQRSTQGGQQRTRQRASTSQEPQGDAAPADARAALRAQVDALPDTLQREMKAWMVEHGVKLSQKSTTVDQLAAATAHLDEVLASHPAT